VVDPHHVSQLVELTLLSLFVTILVHFVELGVATNRATVRRATSGLPTVSRVALRLLRLVGRLFAAMMLLFGLIHVLDTLAPVAVPDWAGWAIFLTLAAAAVGAELLWNGLLARGLQTWEDRCRRADLLGHHGDNARVVGWRVARSTSRYGAVLLGATIAPIAALVMFARHAGAAGPAEFAVLMAVLAAWGLILIAADFAITLLDPLARLVQQSWFDLDAQSKDRRSPTGVDAVLYPLRINETARQRALRRKRRSTWVAALALRRTAQRYPAGISTEDGRVALLTQLATAGTDLTDEMRRIIDAIVYEEIPETTVSPDIARRSVPPHLDRVRPWLLATTAALVVLVPVVTAVVRAALEIYRQLGH